MSNDGQPWGSIPIQQGFDKGSVPTDIAPRNWHLWQSASELVIAYRCGGRPYASIVEILNAPDPWLDQRKYAGSFREILRDVGEEVHDHLMITRRPRQVIHRVLEFIRFGMKPNGFSIGAFAPYCEPYYSIFRAGARAQSLGVLSEPGLLSSVCDRFGIRCTDAPAAAEILFRCDGDIDAWEDLEPYVVPAARIGGFLSRFVSLVEQEGSQGMEDLLKHSRRESRRRADVIEFQLEQDARDAEAFGEEPEPDLPAPPYEYDPMDLDDPEYRRDSHDPETKEW